MGALEQRMEAHRARARALMPELLGRVDWPRQRLDRHRERLLRGLLNDALGSRWHGDRLRGVGVDPADFRESDLRALPTMTKTDLMEHFDAIATDPRITLARCEAQLTRGGVYLDGECVVIASGGTSGVRAVAVSDWEDLACCFSANLRMALRWATRTGAFQGPPRTASLTAAPGPHASWFLRRIFGTGAPASFSVTDPLPQIVDGLNRADPEFLIVYSSFVPFLLDEFEAGRLRIRPKAIMPAAEPFLPEHEQAVARVWGCAILASWAASEVGLLGVGSGFESGMLLADDLAIVELVDAENGPVETGERAARVLVTPLYRRALPVIRYELDDQLVATGQVPVCGSGFAHTSYVEGRADDVFEYADGAVVHPHVFRTLLGRHASIREYQVRQTPRGADVLLATSSAVDVQEICASLARALQGSGVAGAVVRAERVESIERSPGAAKLRRFVPLR